MGGVPVHCEWCGKLVERECDRPDLEHWCKECYVLVVGRIIAEETQLKKGS